MIKNWDPRIILSKHKMSFYLLISFCSLGLCLKLFYALLKHFQQNSRKRMIIWYEIPSTSNTKHKEMKTFIFAGIFSKLHFHLCDNEIFFLKKKWKRKLLCCYTFILISNWFVNKSTNKNPFILNTELKKIFVYSW